MRFIPEIAGFIYATRARELFVNLYIGSSAQVKLGGAALRLKQETRYPWDGKVTLILERVGPTVLNSPVHWTPDPRPSRFTLNLRIPGWALNQPVPSDLYRYEDGLQPQIRLAVNGQCLNPPIEKGFARITRSWKSGDTITLEMDMPVRRVVAHPQVKADQGRFAFERGPLVYCAEGADNGGRVLDWAPSGQLTFSLENQPRLLGGVATVKVRTDGDENALTCIPYYAWCHRGPNEMRVWFPLTSKHKSE